MIHGQITRIATAPVSFGLFGLEPEAGDAEALIEAMSAAGFEGTELGPPGYLGSPSKLLTRLERHHLMAAGAYAAIRFADPGLIEADVRQATRSLTELEAAGSGRAPLILADGGSKALLAHPARAWWDRGGALDEEGWERLVEVVKRMEVLAADAGVPLSFHPHISTYMESVWEIERLLALTGVGLTLDTGHLFLAGAAATECLRAWKDRINHIHLKDVHVDVMTSARQTGRTDFAEWWARVCCPLGTGDVDLEPFLDELVAVRYDGWIVIEQDRPPTPVADYKKVAMEQKTNLDWLRARLPAASVRDD